jgi:hypothetical protein
MSSPLADRERYKRKLITRMAATTSQSRVRLMRTIRFLG